MRVQANFPKRIAEQTARIRKIADQLPVFQRHALLNACGSIEHATRRSIKSGALPDPQEEHDAIAERCNTNRSILAAMMAGRHLSYLDRKEFKTTEWHTRINEVKTMVAKNYPQYTFCDRWESDGHHPYKVYWLEMNVNE